MFIKKIIAILCILYCITLPAENKPLNIGLLIVATGKYIQFAEPLIDSARTHFCPGHNVTYFVFTDGQITHPAHDIVTVYQKKLGWPFDTMMRFEMYDRHREKIKIMDYLFALDADMRFVDTVGDEILGELVGTQHPGQSGKNATYETRASFTRLCRL